MPLAIGNENNTNFPSLMTERNIEKYTVYLQYMFCFLDRVSGSPMGVTESCFFFFFYKQGSFLANMKYQKGLLVDQYKLNQLKDWEKLWFPGFPRRSSERTYGRIRLSLSNAWEYFSSVCKSHRQWPRTSAPNHVGKGTVVDTITSSGR